MGHLITSQQDNTPKTIIPSPHMILVSHTKCEPHEIEWPNTNDRLQAMT